jgi:alanyl-tRNA synthetase
MQSSEIRLRFLKFFESRGHKIIPSASLVPENDPSVLFNTAGMQPLVPYLLGQKHPMGTRLVDSQKCVRTNDIDEVGDKTHLTFFEMLGNWSLGDYWKEESINWSFELLTSKDEGFGLDPQKLYVTCFEGDENAPRDEESAGIWQEIFEKNNVTGERIYFRPKEKNWWSAGENGPCGPDTEMFYDMTGELNKGMTLEEYLRADQEQKIVEIWNNVFMEYLSENGKVVSKLKNKNVDTGSGFERLVAVIQGKNSVYETDLFNNEQTKEERIISDHIKASLFMISDGVIPSNTGRGYVLRRLIRRAVRFSKEPLDKIIERNKNIYKGIYILDDKGEIQQEEQRFRDTLERGLKEFEKGIDPFILATTYGFPIELTLELAKEKNIEINMEDFNKKMAEHQKLSQTASAGMFKGGLANHGEQTIRLHTAHHLLLAGLQSVLGKDVKQKGSNITEERLRMDFICDHKLTDEEKKKVEDFVNEKIQQKLEVVRREMPLKEAEKLGAEMEFGAKYPDIVSVYFIEDKDGNPISKEFCGGPHVKNTSELGHFKIQKEEAVSAGVRRIKAILL